ncbi:HD domain-containing protein [Paludibaculum fermentans]|uniref:HD domain-containing protein n=1 Tax=Paludibaculum fermentans TaxID=1473598 RepID=UPI003EBDA89B
MDSPLIFFAIQFAAAAHSGQYRKGTNVPYLIHPMRAAATLLDAGCRETVAVAAMLHDTVEDCFVTYEQIEALFGAEVAELVRGASEPDKAASWEHRKEHTIELLRSANEDLLMVAIADKIDNIRSIREDIALRGEDAWKRFRRGREQQRWYYQSLAEVFEQRLTGQPGAGLASVFSAEVSAVFQ